MNWTQQQDFIRSIVRPMSAAAVKILLLLTLRGGSLTGRELEEGTGFSDKSIKEGLSFLERAGLIKHHGRLVGWGIAFTTEDEFHEILAAAAKLDTRGGVYLCESNGRYKIGVSNQPAKRVEAMNVSSPYPVRLLHTFPADDPVSAEKELHEMFRSYRVHGEWFELNEFLLQLITNTAEYKDGRFVSDYD
jgi:hypothetical protein